MNNLHLFQLQQRLGNLQPEPPDQLLRQPIRRILQQPVQIPTLTELRYDETKRSVIEHFENLDGVFALDQLLALDLVLEHRFLLLGLEQLLVDHFHADDFASFGVDASVYVAGHATAEFLVEGKFVLAELFHHRQLQVGVVRGERCEAVHLGGFL